MAIEKIKYMGFKNCYKISWNHFRVIVTTDVGPRIISLQYNEGSSIFAVQSNPSVISPNEGWKLFGGHRLWHAPEQNPRTYYPDNSPIQIEIVNEYKIILRQETELTTGIKKTISLELKGTGRLSHIEVNHYLENKGQWPIEVAPWAISVMAPTTCAIIPLSNNDPSGLLPKTSISIWNYTKLNDPRFTFGEKYILVKQDPESETSTKIGSKVNSGWSAAIHKSTLFVKMIDTDTSNLKADFGANVEVYTSSDILELETVGQLLPLNPSPLLSPPLDLTTPNKITKTTPQVSKLTEKWYLFETESPSPSNDGDVDKNILPIVNEILQHQ
ncbi:hypothetical protein DICPUDRAFT_151832 [Dictyostelium purpureum]|uniref:Uncharacterized protein n=1 Tax=Dictyostelium purpureum TaxID=5786 RepID=F0ZJV4_DICPU|nr:uncharacterized protein DICPUDRAFT_151832 [Dictyostelium purpureum]EGC35805.1 hypothetical protein DICPUDRAFT_151832 [Dictyostelium purpureum]|eukprot:XP_003287699.1 hypothetical protein DICPUDRAFT_151832 [Dictyostelium purpureum]